MYSVSIKRWYVYYSNPYSNEDHGLAVFDDKREALDFIEENIASNKFLSMDTIKNSYALIEGYAHSLVAVEMVRKIDTE